MAKEARKRGRPALPEPERRRKNVTLRMRDQLKAQLEEAAADSQRSLSEEIEARLESSIAGDNAVGGKGAAAILDIIGRVLRETGQTAGFFKYRTLEAANSWLLDPYAYDQAKRAVDAVLEAMRPPGDPVPPRFTRAGAPDAELNTTFQDLGPGLARTVLEAVAEPSDGRTLELQKWGASRRRQLGAAADHLSKRSKKQ